MPSDLGYYDLRVPEVMRAHWDLATTVMESTAFAIITIVRCHPLVEPASKTAASIRPRAYPFACAGRMRNWTRRWDGQDQGY